MQWGIIESREGSSYAEFRPDPDSYRDYRDARERGEHKFITINYYCLLP
jgi:hypothetical protein